MRFGGHETFPVREGWLHKGLKLLTAESPEERCRLVADDAADWLGVGRNMAKSIRHWLVATGLAKPMMAGRRITTHAPEPTDLGKLIWKHDRYFIEPTTWWILHVNMVHAEPYAYTWHWFFNSFNFDRFEKSTMIEHLRRSLQFTNRIPPSQRTLDRDVSCFLATYSRAVPPRSTDPEETLESPFTELRFLTHYRSSGYYQLHRGPKAVPAHVFAYTVTKARKEQADDSHDTIDVSMHDLVHRTDHPGRVFGLTAEALFEMLLEYEDEDTSPEMDIVGLAGERRLRMRRRNPIEVLASLYETTGQEAQYAA